MKSFNQSPSVLWNDRETKTIIDECRNLMENEELADLYNKLPVSFKIFLLFT